jgi:UDP-N-acetyl-D-galactosamine dehydrogenase
MKNIRNDNVKISVIGLGYVGLCLAVELNKRFRYVIGFDNKDIIDKYNNGLCNIDTVSINDFNNSDILFTSNNDDLINSDLYIIAVPTPANEKNIDLNPLIFSTVNIASIIKNNKKPSIICYESTVYPGVTNNICNQIFVSAGLIRNKDYFLVYSPERINVGDENHIINNVTKIIASDSKIAKEFVSDVYSTFIDYDSGGDIILSDSIEAAEAAKLYENCQRDINIAFANEFAVNMNELNINMSEVLRLAKTKWNALNFTPGLVGGHCIAEDPYYMIELAKSHKLSSNILEDSRKINEYIPTYLANKIIELIHNYIKDKVVNDIRIGVLGITFKEDTNDIRNSKIINLVNELYQNGRYTNFIYNDPLADNNEVNKMYNISLSDLTEFKDLDVLIIAVKHKEYIKDISKYSKYLNPNKAILIDLFGCCIGELSEKTNILYWRYC